MGLLLLQAAVDLPRPVVLCPVEGMLRSDQNKHIPPSPPTLSRQSCPLGAQGMGQALEEASAHPAPAPTLGNTGHTEDPSPAQEPGWTSVTSWGSSNQDSALPSAAGTGLCPLAGDLLISPHILHQAGLKTLRTGRASRGILSQETLIKP